MSALTKNLIPYTLSSLAMVLLFESMQAHAENSSVSTSSTSAASLSKLPVANPTAEFEISAGAEQDSNLNVVELDKKSNESEIAALLNGKVNASWQPVEKLSLSGGYAYSSKTYQKNDAYNLAIHQLSLDANYDFTAVTVGANYNTANAALDGKSFLDLSQTSFYLSKLINNKIYLRAAINNQDKKFSGLSGRDATNTGFSGDVFIFSNAGKTFVNLGISNEKEDAREKQFDYSGVNLKAKVSNKFSFRDKENKLQLGYRYLKRDYSGITPDINAKRYDSGNIAEASWEISFTPKISLETKVEKGTYKSNVDAADYSENRVSMLLKARF